MTPERINRHDDECLYQPRIHSRRIRELYRISQGSGEPMTVLVDQAVAEFIAARADAYPESDAAPEPPPFTATGRRDRASRELPSDRPRSA